jgi:glycosyltransferase involved in cell wall biosynthesis
MRFACYNQVLPPKYVLPNMNSSLTPSPAASVLMPCYNAAATLPDALDSLDRQTLQNFEIIAVDDGSTDETAEILRQKAAHDVRLRIISQPHTGIIAALNSGLAACRAGYVARMDSDDRCHPERLVRQVSYLDQHPQAAAVSCLVEAFPPGQVRQGFRIYVEWLNSLVSDEDMRREIFVESPMAHPSVTFRKAWVEGVGSYQERGWAEDYDLWLRLNFAGARFAKLEQVLLQWRERPERLTRTDGRYSLENFLRAKAYYLAQGPLRTRDAVIVWGAGMMGRRLSKHLLRHNIPLRAFIDIDPAKIGRTRRGRPINAPEQLPDLWKQFDNPVLLAAVGARGARVLIRQRLKGYGLREGIDWWSTA